MATTFANLLYHIVFTNKGRLPLIRDDLRDPLYEYIGGILRGERGILLEIGGVPDHVHLLVKLKTDIAVSLMVQKIKAKSSKWINERQSHVQRFEWQAGYGIFSVSESLVGKVQTYIQGQEEHHKKVPFRDELIALLQRNRLQFDERYLLG
jgi:REP element-mobilizing transposase RayT